ncbi:MAG TPA: helicase C-terminal domain-containing protein [Chthoniobacteraceae bacterium]|nr:helicase C-terminal domain-containing protein [Chthoniobacteraceae bacterium]
MPSAPYECSTSVRALVEFVYRSGDLVGEGMFRPSNRAVEGTRGHRRLQQARGEGYRAEVPVERVLTRGGIALRLTGRVDGVLEGGGPPVIEEIKTVDARWSGREDPLHLAQLRLYGALLTMEHGWEAVELHLTYLDYQIDEETIFRSGATAAELAGFLEATLAPWLEWVGEQAAWKATRDASLAAVGFPFGGFRAGQRALARRVYRAVRDGGRLLVEAPTGLGKTMATLFPAIKALPLLGEGQVFYVTAKTPGRHAAEEALGKLRKEGVRLRSLMLTAKERICFGPQPCDPRACPFAIGYYDRFKPAVRELLACEHLDRDTVEAVARKHQVCPFELSLDASLWTDVVVGDFNYVFDPTARLQRHFGEGPARHVVLVDESHNLVDRSREMHSASLQPGELEIGPSRLKGRGLNRARKAVAEAREALEAFLLKGAEPAGPPAEPEPGSVPPRPHHDGAIAFAQAPAELITLLRQTTYSIEAFLAELEPGSDLSGWLEPWFAIGAFLRAADHYDATCRTIVDPAQQRATLFCLDPSQRLREVLKGLRTTVFFSATLSPLDYFRDLLGCDVADEAVQFASPFEPEQMGLAIRPLDVTYKGRSASLPEVARSVARHLEERRGNHLVFCPSLAYLATLEEELSPLLPQGRFLFSQTAAMNEAERGAFLARFEPGAEGVGLAVLGGIFAEGIDLPGERLEAVTVIGVGLPRLSLERDLLQLYFEATHGAGFDYAYRFPGMQRVLQAVGRLIRAEEDHGSALLVDYRFNERRYRLLFPHWWRVGGEAGMP